MWLLQFNIAEEDLVMFGGDSDGSDSDGSDSEHGSYLPLDAPDEGGDGRAVKQERRAYRARREHWKVSFFLPHWAVW
jgi:hypothetical protein